MNDETVEEEGGWLFTKTIEPRIRSLRGSFGAVVSYARPSPDRRADEPSQDTAGVILTPEGIVLAVADGVGGTPGGEPAAALAVTSLRDALRDPGEGGVRSAVMDAFEHADSEAQSTSGVGRTTFVVVELSGRSIRTFHAGDSEVLVVGGRGRIKLRTMSHSPVGYQVAAGVLDEPEAMLHEERHFVSNVLGAVGMRIEVGPINELSVRDTLVLGSDGLFDNVTAEEIAALVRSGELEASASALAEKAVQRMLSPEPNAPSKVDDLTFILCRPGAQT